MTLKDFIDSYEAENIEFFNEHNSGEYDSIDDFRADSGDKYDMMFRAKGYQECLEDLKNFALKNKQKECMSKSFNIDCMIRDIAEYSKEHKLQIEINNGFVRCGTDKHKTNFHSASNYNKSLCILPFVE